MHRANKNVHGFIIGVGSAVSCRKMLCCEWSQKRSIRLKNVHKVARSLPKCCETMPQNLQKMSVIDYIIVNYLILARLSPLNFRPFSCTRCRWCSCPYCTSTSSARSGRGTTCRAALRYQQYQHQQNVVSKQPVDPVYALNEGSIKDFVQGPSQFIEIKWSARRNLHRLPMRFFLPRNLVLSFSSGEKVSRNSRPRHKN